MIRIVFLIQLIIDHFLLNARFNLLYIGYPLSFVQWIHQISWFTLDIPCDLCKVRFFELNQILFVICTKNGYFGCFDTFFLQK